MSKLSKQVGPQRYRETFGRYFEDFEVGDDYEHRPGQGIVTIRTLGRNQRGEVIATFRRDMLIPARGHAVEDKMDTY